MARDSKEDPPKAAPLRVLVIDDERPIVDAVRMVLDEFDVVGVTSVADARAFIDRGERFDVVLCDLSMPGVSGMAFFASLDPEHKARVVFLTGGAFTPASRDFLASVPNRCVEKPFPVESLRQIVRETGGV
jgi:DNA-binding NtrC family response regulator